jgi:hypothetical protein
VSGEGLGTPTALPLPLVPPPLAPLAVPWLLLKGDALSMTPGVSGLLGSPTGELGRPGIGALLRPPAELFRASEQYSAAARDDGLAAPMDP